MSATAAVVIALLLPRLISQWFGELREIAPLVPLVLFLAMPELVYLGLIFNPMLWAMAFLLASHLILRARWQSWPFVVGSAVLFGVGAAFRWDTLPYGLTIVADVLFVVGRDWSIAKRIRLSFLWGGLALLSWAGIILLIGIRVDTIRHLVANAGPLQDPPGLLEFTAQIAPFLTPGVAILGAIGTVTLIRRRDPFLAVLLLGLAGAAMRVEMGVPKWIISCLPVVCGVVLLGFFVLWQRRPLVRVLVGILLLGPWLIGLKATYKDSAWGPGFEMRPYARPVDNTLKIIPVFGAGAAVPTPEGPRALFGHAYVLFWQWRPFVRENDLEQQRVIQVAMDRRLPLLQDQGQGLAIVKLVAAGMRTEDPYRQEVTHAPVISRQFSGPSGNLLVVRLAEPGTLLNAQVVSQLAQNVGPQVAIYASPRTMRNLFLTAPDALEKIGPQSAVLNLERLAEAL
jgi:hypothetical protein